MKLVNLQCPNCSGSLVKEGENLVCHACGGTFSIDYDESDVEFEKIKTEPERDQRRLEHEKELLEKKFELEQKALRESEKRAQIRSFRKRLIITLIIVFAVIGSITLSVIMAQITAEQNARYNASIETEKKPTNTPRPSPTPTPAPNYHITPEDVEDLMDDLIAVGQKAEMDIDQCGAFKGSGAIKFFDKTDAVFVDAYIVTDIPEQKLSRSNRVVLIYEVTWYNEDAGEQKCYDAVYFEGLKIYPGDTKVVCDYAPETIDRSDAAWGWGMAYSFEEYDQCYRENVSALGGNVTPIKAEEPDSDSD